MDPTPIALKREGNGTLEECDVYFCPVCSGDLIEGWDTTGPDSFVGDSHYRCACGYHAVEECEWKGIGPDDWISLPRIVRNDF